MWGNTEPVGMFGTVAGIRQQPGADELLCRLADQRRKLWRVLAGTLAGHRASKQVRGQMARQR